MEEKLNLASSCSTEVKGKGSVVVHKNDSSNVIFQNTLYVPDLRHNLISVAKITDKGCNVTFSKDVARVIDQNGQIRLTANRKGNLYFFDEGITQTSLGCHENVWTWHERLGHLNVRDLEKLLNKCRIDLNSDFKRLIECEICAKGKMSALPFSRRDGPCNEKLRIVHSDVVGPMRTESLGGAKYFVTFIDDSTRWCEVYLLSKKSQVLNTFKVYKNYVEKQTNMKIKCLQTDNGGEYCSKEFDDFLKEEGIQRRLTIAHTPQQNGVAERMNRTIVEMARCLLLSSGLSSGFWGEAVVTACHIRNRCPSKSIGGEIPFEKWHKIPVNLDHLKIFGSKVFFLEKTVKDKFDNRAKEGIFIGYPRESKGYRIWIPSKNKVTIARDVKFHNECKDHKKETVTKEKDEVKNKEQTKEEEGIVEMEILQNKSKNYDEPELTMKRGPGRPRIDRSGTGRPKKIYNMVEVNSQKSENESTEEQLESAGVAEISLKDAMSSVEQESWKEAILSEINSLVKNDTFDIVKKPSDRSVVGCRYVLTVKHNDNTEKKKARLVAKGYSQLYGLDYNNTFAPVARLQTIRLLVALAVELGMEIHQMDVNTAYLNGNLEEEIYMQIPELLYENLQKIRNQESKNTIIKEKVTLMLKNIDEGGNVCKLKRSIYGLKQAGRQWFIKLDETLRKLKLKPTINEPCLYHMRRGDGVMMFIVVYVDDLLLASQDKNWIKDVKKSIEKEFEMKDFGLAKSILGIEIKQLEEGIVLSQEKYK